MLAEPLSISFQAGCKSLEENLLICPLTDILKFLRATLMGTDSRSAPPEETSRTTGLDNYGIINMQKQVMKGVVSSL